MKDDVDFDPKLSDIAKLFKHPERNYHAFDDEYGDGASVRVITTSQPRFKREDVAKLLQHPVREATEFDATYGNGAADKLLSGHLGRDKKRQKRVKRALAREAERVRSGQSRESYDGERDKVLDAIESRVAKEGLKNMKEEQEALAQEDALQVQEEKTKMSNERRAEKREEDKLSIDDIDTPNTA